MVNLMTLIDETIASQNLLQLLERLDRILEIYGGTRKNERTATIALYNSLFPLSSMYSINHTKVLFNEMIVMRNVNIDREIYDKVFKGPPLGQTKTELDLFFLNAPTVIGHPSKGKINFYVEIEMGDVSSEEQHLTRLRRYFKEKGLEIYPILVCSQYKDWDDTFELPILDISDLEKIAESVPITSLDDLPGVAYEWAATSLRILEYIASRGEVDINREINFRSGLWEACPSLKQHDFRKLIERGKISAEDYEDFNVSFRNRINSVFRKMHEKGLLNKNERGNYELSIDGRDILACYLSFKEGCE